MNESGVPSVMRKFSPEYPSLDGSATNVDIVLRDDSDDDDEDEEEDRKKNDGDEDDEDDEDSNDGYSE